MTQNCHYLFSFFLRENISHPRSTLEIPETAVLGKAKARDSIHMSWRDRVFEPHLLPAEGRWIEREIRDLHPGILIWHAQRHPDPRARPALFFLISEKKVTSKPEERLPSWFLDPGKWLNKQRKSEMMCSLNLAQPSWWATKETCRGSWEWVMVDQTGQWKTHCHDFLET